MGGRAVLSHTRRAGGEMKNCSIHGHTYGAYENEVCCECVREDAKEAKIKQCEENGGHYLGISVIHMYAGTGKDGEQRKLSYKQCKCGYCEVAD